MFNKCLVRGRCHWNKSAVWEISQDLKAPRCAAGSRTHFYESSRLYHWWLLYSHRAEVSSEKLALYQQHVLPHKERCLLCVLFSAIPRGFQSLFPVTSRPRSSEATLPVLGGVRGHLGEAHWLACSVRETGIEIIAALFVRDGDQFNDFHWGFTFVFVLSPSARITKTPLTSH